jgi:hypothetical protein
MLPAIKSQPFLTTPFSIQIPKIRASASLPYLDGEVAKGCKKRPWQGGLEIYFLESGNSVVTSTSSVTAA